MGTSRTWEKQGKGPSPRPSLESDKYLPKFCFNSFIVFIYKFLINLGICRGGEWGVAASHSLQNRS